MAKDKGIPRRTFRLRKDEDEALSRIAKKNNTTRTGAIRQMIKDNTD